jgi:hypothetical protein
MSRRSRSRIRSWSRLACGGGLWSLLDFNLTCGVIFGLWQ